MNNPKKFSNCFKEEENEILTLKILFDKKVSKIQKTRNFFWKLNLGLIWKSLLYDYLNNYFRQIFKIKFFF